MARPRKDASERRTNLLPVRLTPAERLRIEKDALGAGLTASDFVRTQALKKGRPVVRETVTLDPAVFDELRRIGVNLNQIARRANQSGRISPALSHVCETLESILMRELDHGSASGQSARPAKRGDDEHGDRTEGGDGP